MKRAYYDNTIVNFLKVSKSEIVGTLSQESNYYQLLKTQTKSWEVEIDSLKQELEGISGHILFEYDIPRMGRRIDVVLLIKHVVFVLEFKVGQSDFPAHAVDQVYDYALDLKNFHEGSQGCIVAPILIATNAEVPLIEIPFCNDDLVLRPIKTNISLLRDIIEKILIFTEGEDINVLKWIEGRYSPTPTIIEAAISLFNNHSVTDITRSDASAINLSQTSQAVSDVIARAKSNLERAICFVTGVPGAGKTLVGLDVATRHLDKDSSETSVFLSGNGPLVAILREALTRDRVSRQKDLGLKLKKSQVASEVKMFIQNVHHFRDEYLKDKTPPKDHVAIFDEAQRAWDKSQTANFMARKRSQVNFDKSEPEFLISCLDRHKDWAVVVCLVGGGQEIHTGEAGIREWIDSINAHFPAWKIYLSSKLQEDEYGAQASIAKINPVKLNVIDHFHLSVSMRSFRAERVSKLIAAILDFKVEEARTDYESLKGKYPIVITRSINSAKNWLKEKARGSERYGIVVSSQAIRLKPLAIDIRVPTDPIHWFLNGKEDIRSSYYLEDVATEFQVQGLELDWVCVAWDADFRCSHEGWKPYSFRGDKWQHIRKLERQRYIKNAYRVLLTRARQGMVILVPEGDVGDATRSPEFYDETYGYLRSLGVEQI